MSDPTDLSFWFGGDATKNLNPQGQHGEQLNSQLQGYLGQAGQNPLSFGNFNQDRAQQGTLASHLGAIAQGNQVGAGEMAVNRQMGQAQAAQTALARIARGANSVLAARQAARNQADLNVAGAGQAAQAAQGDQAAARSQLAQLLGQMQSGDLSQQGLVQNQYNLQNQARLGYLAQLLGLNQQGFQNQATINGIGLQDKGVFPSILQGAAAIGAAAAA
jgi:hypothetical protein